MSITTLLLIAVGLSMDAFTVALCKGLSMRKINYAHAGVIALFFGGFQGGMPLIGWFLGKQFETIVTRFAPWIAFVLLGYIGGKMIWDAFHEEDEGTACAAESKLDLKELFMMAVATSIDALAVGISFAGLHVKIVPAVTAIGVITAALSFVGVIIGNKFGNRFQNKAQFAGGLVLVGIGVKVLVEYFIESGIIG